MKTIPELLNSIISNQEKIIEILNANNKQDTPKAKVNNPQGDGHKTTKAKGVQQQQVEKS